MAFYKVYFLVKSKMYSFDTDSFLCDISFIIVYAKWPLQVAIKLPVFSNLSVKSHQTKKATSPY